MLLQFLQLHQNFLGEKDVLALRLTDFGKSVVKRPGAWCLFAVWNPKQELCLSPFKWIFFALGIFSQGSLLLFLGNKCGKCSTASCHFKSDASLGLSKSPFFGTKPTISHKCDCTLLQKGGEGLIYIILMDCAQVIINHQTVSETD